MSEENAEVVVAAYEAFAARGVDGFGEFLTDDVDYRAVEGAPDDRGPMHGKEALRPYVQDWLDTFDEFTAQPVELVDAGGPGCRRCSNQRASQVQRCGDHYDLRRHLRNPRRKDCPRARVHDPRRSSRSRRSGGVGDGGGERLGRERALERWATGNLTEDCFNSDVECLRSRAKPTECCRADVPRPRNDSRRT